MEDAGDLKSLARKGMEVRILSGLHANSRSAASLREISLLLLDYLAWREWYNFGAAIHGKDAHHESF